MLEKYEKNIYQALKQDLNKSTFETFTTELGFLYNEIKHLEKNLKEWMKDEPVDAPLTHKGTKSLYSQRTIWSYFSYLPLELSVTFGDCTCYRKELPQEIQLLLNRQNIVHPLHLYSLKWSKKHLILAF